MPKKGFRNSYLGGHSFVQADVFGGGKGRKKGLMASKVTWSTDTPDAGRPSAEAIGCGQRLLKSKEVEKLRHSRPSFSRIISNPSVEINEFRRLPIHSQLEALGYGRIGFEDLAASTDSKIGLVRNEVGSSAADIALALNRVGWKTLSKHEWTFELLGIFLQYFSEFTCGVRIKKRNVKRILREGRAQ